LKKIAKFQSFEEQSSPKYGPKRLTSLRRELKSLGLAGFLIPRSDMYQGEIVAPVDERLSWLTGFTGSAGFCVVLMKKAGVFVDGRYRVQVKNQTNKVFTPVDWPETTLVSWLSNNMSFGESIGFDPWLHSLSEIEKTQNELADLGIKLRPIANPIDKLWKDQPNNPTSKAFVYDIKYSGQSHKEKRISLANQLKQKNHAATIITLPENIAWILNIRGNDIAHVPIVQSVGILYSDSSFDLFINLEKVADIKSHLGTEVRCNRMEDFPKQLRKLKGKVRIDPNSIPFAVANILKKNKIIFHAEDDLVALSKAKKNSIEILQAREAHNRDAAAMCEFLCWLDNQDIEKISEIDVVIALEEFRRVNTELLDISFDTISASGPNAALPHYRVTKVSDRMLKQGQVLLVDSGGQYLDGTTDITRTIAVGVQEKYVCEAFTRVLKGMISISCLKFPRGTAGRDIDAFARSPLWAAGQDFSHGTGHGVGHFLSVHEGPQRISPKSSVPLEEGMIVSNEPGYYLEGKFGIRIENLLLVTAVQKSEFLEFKTLNFVPVDKRMIVKKMLNKEEVSWLNHYHQICFDNNFHRLTPVAAKWLKKATSRL